MQPWGGLPEHAHWDLLAGTYKLLNGCFHVQRGCWSFHPADVVSVNWGVSPFLFIFHLQFFQKGPPQPERRCDPGKGIIWLPVAPSLSSTRLARSSFLSVFLSLAPSLLEILPLSPGMDVPPETSKHVKKSTSQKLEDQKKVRRVVHSYSSTSAGLKVQDHQQCRMDEILHSSFLAVLKAAVGGFLYILLFIYKQIFRWFHGGVGMTWKQEGTQLWSVFLMNINYVQ